MKILIVGTGRCGTKTMSKLLNENNIKCGHESIFGLNKSSEISEESIKLKIDSYEAESSWLSVPYLSTDIISNETKIIHLLRHPIKVIKSFLDISFFKSKGKYYKFLLKNTDYINENNSPVINCALYYLFWNMKIEENLKKFSETISFRIEDSPEKLKEFIPIHNFKISKENTKIHEKNNNYDEELIKNEIKESWFNNEFQEYIKKYDYHI